MEILVNSGATDNFMDSELAKQLKIKGQETKLKVQLANQREQKVENEVEEVLRLPGHQYQQMTRFLVLPLGQSSRTGADLVERKSSQTDMDRKEIPVGITRQTRRHPTNRLV